MEQNEITFKEEAFTPHSMVIKEKALLQERVRVEDKPRGAHLDLEMNEPTSLLGFQWKGWQDLIKVSI